ncbi:MAG: autotransporter-associated beta strand repeat-containing protein, partial [Puniceicoccales bacterium]|nr:autotransporter-associated beta strand repeat-containing protein [Puniceicoccales bacterium]
MVASAGQIQAETYYWVGGASGNWSAANAWNTALDNSGTPLTWNASRPADTAIIGAGFTVFNDFATAVPPGQRALAIQLEGVINLSGNWLNCDTLSGNGTITNKSGGGLGAANNGNDIIVYADSTFDGIFADGTGGRTGATALGCTLTLTNVNTNTFRMTLASATGDSIIKLTGAGSIDNSYVNFKGTNNTRFDISGISREVAIIKMIGTDVNAGAADGQFILGSKYLQIGHHGQSNNTSSDWNGTSHYAGIAGSIGSANGTDTGGIIKEGKFALTFNPVLDGRQARYRGETRINEGVFRLGGNATTGATAMASSAGIVLAAVSAADASFDIATMAASDTYIQTLNGGGGVTLGAKGLRIGGTVTSPLSEIGTITGTGAGVFDGVISGTNGQLNKDGTGTLTLGGVNIYTGKTTVSGGVLTFSGSGSIATSSAIEITGGELRLTDSAQVNATAAISVTAGTLSLGSGVANFSNALGVSNSGSLLLNGQTLGGSTVVNVGSGAHVGGTGTLKGDVTIGAGGTLVVGNVGSANNTLSLSGDVILEAGATVEV